MTRKNSKKKSDFSKKDKYAHYLAYATFQSFVASLGVV